MTLDTKQIEQDSPDLRARLAERLLDSLETLSAGENEALWVAEALRRDHEMDTDESQARSAEEVFKEVRASL
jgi:putative addiction module component (TIGR02574 family)